MEKPTYDTLVAGNLCDVFHKVIQYADSVRPRPINDGYDGGEFLNSVGLGWAVFNEDPDFEPVSSNEPFGIMINAVQENGWEQGILRVAELFGLDRDDQNVFLKIVKELGEVKEHRFPDDIFSKMKAAKAEAATYMATPIRHRDGYLIDVIDK